MSWYSLLIFVHVLGAIGIFAGWGAEAVLLQRLRRAVVVEEARTSAQQLRKYGRVGPIAMGLVVLTGILMMLTQWGHQPWMAAAILAVIGIGVVGGVAGRRTRPHMTAALAGRSEGSEVDLDSAAASLASSLQLQVAIGVGIIGLMTMKPGALGSFMILGGAFAVGLIVAFRDSWQRRASVRGRHPLQSR